MVPGSRVLGVHGAGERGGHQTVVAAGGALLGSGVGFGPEPVAVDDDPAAGALRVVECEVDAPKQRVGALERPRLDDPARDRGPVRPV